MITDIAFRLGLTRHDCARRLEQVQTAIVWALPRWVIYWATIRLFAHGTTGQWETTVPSTLNFGDALQRWETEHEQEVRDAQ